MRPRSAHGIGQLTALSKFSEDVTRVALEDYLLPPVSHLSFSATMTTCKRTSEKMPVERELMMRVLYSNSLLVSLVTRTVHSHDPVAEPSKERASV